jgi:hypothetical protein
MRCRIRAVLGDAHTTSKLLGRIEALMDVTEDDDDEIDCAIVKRDVPLEVAANVLAGLMWRMSVDPSICSAGRWQEFVVECWRRGLPTSADDPDLATRLMASASTGRALTPADISVASPGGKGFRISVSRAILDLIIGWKCDGDFADFLPRFVAHAKTMDIDVALTD